MIYHVPNAQWRTPTGTEKDDTFAEGTQQSILRQGIIVEK